MGTESPGVVDGATGNDKTHCSTVSACAPVAVIRVKLQPVCPGPHLTGTPLLPDPIPRIIVWAAEAGWAGEPGLDWALIVRERDCGRLQFDDVAMPVPGSALHRLLVAEVVSPAAVALRRRLPDALCIEPVAALAVLAEQ